MALPRKHGGWLRRNLPIPTAVDMRLLAILLFLAAFMFLPRRARHASCELVARVLMRRGSAYHGALASQLPHDIQQRLGPSTHRALLRSETLVQNERLLTLRAVVLPWQRRRVAIEGLGHVEAALARANGAILWVHPCLGSNLAVKEALHENGLPLVHLTRPGHPVSSSPFGVRFMNPIFRVPESRFLRERVVIDDGQVVAPLRTLRRRLAENRVVSVTVTHTASHVDDVPFLDGYCRLPDGPITLAAASGAALLPVFTAGSLPVPRVIIGPRLEIAGPDRASIQRCELAAADWLAAQVLEHPADWTGWRVGLFRKRAPGDPIPSQSRQDPG